MLTADTSDFEYLGRAIAKLPDEIKVKATARAMRRVSEIARTRLIRRQVPRLKIPNHVLQQLTTAKFNAGGRTSEVVQRSHWIPLHKLGRSTQTKTGVTVRGRGSYRSAFLATMASGHRGVMSRVGKERLPIRELFGPNPAHDITNNEQIYLELLAEVMAEVVAPEMLKQISDLLPKR